MEEIIEDPDLAQAYTIYRSTGAWVDGRWVEGTPVRVPAKGTIVVAREKDLRQVPEGDRVGGMMVFYNKAEIFPTRITTNGATSDKIFWHNDWYKIVSVSPYGDYGFYSAIGERITGA